MFNLTVNIFKIIRWVGPLPHGGPHYKNEGFGGNRVKYRSASKKNINPYLIILCKQLITRILYGWVCNIGLSNPEGQWGREWTRAQPMDYRLYKHFFVLINESELHVFLFRPSQPFIIWFIGFLLTSCLTFFISMIYSHSKHKQYTRTHTLNINNIHALTL